MSHKIKLYDKNGKFVKFTEPFRNKVNELTALNKNGFFIKAQFNKSMTQVITSYTDFKLRTQDQIVCPFSDSNSIEQTKADEIAAVARRNAREAARNTGRLG